MPFRYRRRIRVGKGLYVNLGKKGITSVTVGRRGASMNVNRKGTRESIGVPGTGLSYQTKRKTGCLGCGSVLVTLTAVVGAAFHALAVGRHKANWSEFDVRHD